MVRRSLSLQTNFSAGVLDATLASRVDIAAYNQGGKELTNVIGLPHGGVSLRKGLAFFAEVPEANANSRLVKFEFSTEQVYILLLRSGAIDVFLPSGEKCVSVATPYLDSEIATVCWTQSLDTLILVHPNHAPAKLMRQGSHRSWVLSDLILKNIPQYDFGGDGIKEDVWSATRGWPRSVFLHQGRLYFGGSKSRPQTIWGSKSNEFFDFGTTKAALDDESVEMTFDNDRVCAVQQLYALNNFFAFTTGGLFARGDDGVICPRNFILRRSSEVPSSAVRPAEMDGSVLFIKHTDNGHSSVYELTYNYENESYKAEDIALISGSLMRQPCDMAARLGNEIDSANHLYVVNGSDGTVAVLNSRKSQQMTGWTLLKTSGEVLRVTVVGGTPYFLIRRNIAGVVRYFIEYLGIKHHLDCSHCLVAETAQQAWSGLSRLEGAVVDMVGDGAPLGTAPVKGGEVQTPYPVKDLEVGFAFDWAVETMPIDTSSPDGMASGGRHRVTKAALRLYESGGITVNGRALPGCYLGQERLDAPQKVFSGLRNIRFLGWNGGRLGNDGATVRITGSSCLPATIMSVASEVAQ